MIPRRRCPQCGISLPLTEEYFYRRNSNNPFTFQNQCIECQTDYARRKREDYTAGKVYRMEHMLDNLSISRAVVEYEILLGDMRKRRKQKWHICLI